MTAKIVQLRNIKALPSSLLPSRLFESLASLIPVPPVLLLPPQPARHRQSVPHTTDTMKVSGVVCFMAAAGAANAFVAPVPVSSRMGVVTRAESSLTMAAKKGGKKEEWVAVLKTSDIAPGELVGVTQDGQEILVAADLSGSIYATANICPHLGTPLDQGSINAAGALVCPLHKSAFSLDDGKLVGDWCPFPPVLGPLVLGRLEPPKDLAVFPVRASGGNIQVLLNRNLKQEFESKYWTGLLDAQGKASGDYY